MLPGLDVMFTLSADAPPAAIAPRFGSLLPPRTWAVASPNLEMSLVPARVGVSTQRYVNRDSNSHPGGVTRFETENLCKQGSGARESHMRC